MAPGPLRGFPAALGPFRETGLPEAARRPRLCQGRGARARPSGRPPGGGASRWARPLALNASRRGAAGELGARRSPPPSGPRQRSLPARARAVEPRAAPARAGTPARPRTPTHLPAPGWRALPPYNRSLFVGGGAAPGAAAPRQPTDPIKYYLCLKIPVIGYAAAFSEPCAKLSKIAVRLELFSSCKFPFL